MARPSMVRVGVQRVKSGTLVLSVTERVWNAQGKGLLCWMSLWRVQVLGSGV